MEKDKKEGKKEDTKKGVARVLYKFLDWRKIRSLGELQILTRASYIMLIFVPILAGLWPGVRSTINRYNQIVIDSTIMLEHASNKFQHEAQKIKQEVAENIKNDPDSHSMGVEIASKAHDVILKLNENVDQYVDELSNKTIERKSLPGIWGIAFFASLSVILAHTIYQIWTPDKVKKYSISDYSSLKKAEFANSPTKGAVDIAEWKIKSYRETFQIESDYPERPDDKDFFTTGQMVHVDITKKEIDYVYHAASCEYCSLSVKNIIAVYFSGVLYLIGIVFIAYIIITQSLSVAKAAGWL